MEVAPRTEFVYIELPGCDHAMAIQIVGDSDKERERLARLSAAISEPLTKLKQQEWALQSADIDDYLDPMDLSEGRDHGQAERECVTDVVMIVHGIRDSGFWTKRIAQEVKRLGRTRGTSVRAPTPTYGYFSMWDFVYPGGRERAARWFMELYADVRTHFPNAEVSFVGHSNGTYVAARALELCPPITLKHVVFAGSVVRRSFEWSRHSGRVKKVLNYVGGGDGVVAFLPAVFELLRIPGLDVGGAGAFGFRQAEQCASTKAGLKSDSLGLATPDSSAPRSSSGVELTEARFVRGGHGAAIQESFWPEISRFALLSTRTQFFA